MLPTGSNPVLSSLKDLLQSLVMGYFVSINQQYMKQDDVPKINSLNITPEDQKELDWDSYIMYRINKSEDGTIMGPMLQYDELHTRLIYIVPSFIHDN